MEILLVSKTSTIKNVVKASGLNAWELEVEKLSLQPVLLEADGTIAVHSLVFVDHATPDEVVLALSKQFLVIQMLGNFEPSSGTEILVSPQVKEANSSLIDFLNKTYGNGKSLVSEMRLKRGSQEDFLPLVLVIGYGDQTASVLRSIYQSMSIGKNGKFVRVVAIP